MNIVLNMIFYILMGLMACSLLAIAITLSDIYTEIKKKNESS